MENDLAYSISSAENGFVFVNSECNLINFNFHCFSGGLKENTVQSLKLKAVLLLFFKLCGNDLVENVCF